LSYQVSVTSSPILKFQTFSNAYKYYSTAHSRCILDNQGYKTHLEPFYTSAQNAAFETPHKTRANANRTFKLGKIRTGAFESTRAVAAFKSELAQRQAFPTLAFVTLCNLHRRFIRLSERGVC
jgi:hypothetical protein